MERADEDGNVQMEILQMEREGHEIMTRESERMNSRRSGNGGARFCSAGFE